MRVNCHLIVNQRGTARAVKGLPKLDTDEIAIGINLTIPDAYFQRPYPVIEIKVPDPRETPSPEVVVDITAKTVANALRLNVDAVHDGITQLLRETAEQAEQ
jgi:hypothetical protein